MSHENPHPTTDHANLQAAIDSGHEPSEIGIGRIFLFGAGLVVMSLFVYFVLGLFMSSFGRVEKKNEVARPTQLDRKAGQYPGPQLQPNTTIDMANFLASERAKLDGYGWVDEKAGVAHIPIDRALEILAGRGLAPADVETPGKPAAPGETAPK